MDMILLTGGGSRELAQTSAADDRRQRCPLGAPHRLPAQQCVRLCEVRQVHLGQRG
ncbi:MAG: hypothetical protein MZU95_03385 [Desulfomicrobium escambiense]|nr:hypothetical protein [Desulfomicrobium escambiense]